MVLLTALGFPERLYHGDSRQNIGYSRRAEAGLGRLRFAPAKRENHHAVI